MLWSRGPTLVCVPYSVSLQTSQYLCLRQGTDWYHDHGHWYWPLRTSQSSLPTIPLSAQSLYKLCTELPISQCKHLAWSCATCTLLVPLGSLNRNGASLYSPLPNGWLANGVSHYAFGNLCNVHVLVDTCSSFIYAIGLSGEKASLMIKAFKSAMLVMGVPWALKTDNGPTILPSDSSFPGR